MFVYRGEKLKEENYMKVTSSKYEEMYKRRMQELAFSVDEVKLYDSKVKQNFKSIAKDLDYEDIITYKYEMYKKNYLINRTKYIKEMNELANSYYRYRFIGLDRKYITKENLELIYDQIRECRNSNKKLRVGIDGVMEKKDNKGSIDYIYTNEELQLLSELNEKLIENGYDELVFCEIYHLTDSEDFDKAWGFSKVIDANNAIKECARYILDRKFTPFEAVLYIHQIAGEMLYRKGDNHYEAGRVLPSLISDNNIVCSGYGSFVKAVIDEINLEGLTCELKGCSFLNEYGVMECGHCHNLIHIKDISYGINGVYLNDASFDAKKDEEDVSTVAFCLYPIEDITHFKSEYYEVEADDRLSNLILDMKNARYNLWAISTNPLKKGIGRIFTTINKYKIPSFLKKYYDQSEPILVGKYQEALKFILSDKYKGNELDRIVDEKIICSIDKLLNTFGENSCSDFIKQYKELRTITR